ncbi:MAG TPA: helix-turn-helix transcriptional regulator [Candidatus Limnocylindrales bacterium]|nr:helix-turn-helix transcriptional regulator [Candidatus Limnocylindrales bacterium]
MKSSSAKRKTPEVTHKSGNVFAQLGRPDADDLLRKARVINVINSVIARRSLTQESAAQLVGVDQADISRLANGRINRFSLDRLLTIVDRLGVAIAMEQRRDADGHLVVEVHELAHV